MLRKVLFGVLTVLLALGLVGCGGNKGGDAGKKEEKAPEVVVEGTADKAVLAYAQLYAYGDPDEDAVKAAGMTESDIESVQEQVITPLIEAFKQYPLNNDSVAAMTTQYIGKLKMAMDIKATVKTEDKEHPVVELKATTINEEGVGKVVETNTDLVALGTAYGELQAQGLTEEQLKESPEFQQFALESIDKFINEFPLNPESTLEVTCEAVQGADGKMYWAPQNPEAVAKFVTGQK
ncbi:MAG: DUF5105 domain-containing protein [Selenomonadaceae bacterium]|nr:DUF5105 domain-containing protein [Selenomonadaceae bacterium]